jgi:hydrogenase maturation protein HypF
MTGGGGMRRQRLLVNGIVQGVGFRPFVFNLAESLGLTGFVTNTSEGVIIEIQGSGKALGIFVSRLREQPPPLAEIASVEAEDMLADPAAAGFLIRASENRPGTSTLIPPDVATCADCRREIQDPENRRHGYPFTNCTNCGPRWTIIGRIPYDRPFTSMAPFTMCPACQAEYDDPRDRRFHAQPNACAVCGPRLELVSSGIDEAWRSDPLTAAADLLEKGRILAVKGLGGFHLAVRADDQEAVIRLRRRKNREAKPLAVMCANLATARMLARMSPAEEEALTAAAAPIVLLEKRGQAPLAPDICQGHRRVGVMLAYTPLHSLLLGLLADRGIHALVMTSGNASDEPICLDNDQARARLEGIADAWLLHDRGIIRRADDSVLQVLSDGPLFFRRGRGYAPVPMVLSGSLAQGEPVLAVGPELKNTVCLLKENRAFLSPHIGDLENLEANNFFRETVTTLQDVLECRPRVVAHDLHPGYFSTAFAREMKDVTLVGVQHHHAHLAAVAAEHQLDGPVIGLIMDGTGYGRDGTIWGGEVLAGNALEFTRFAHLETVPLPGGDAAVKAPWRTAVSCLRQALGGDPSRWPELPFLADKQVTPVLEILSRNLNSPLTSSCGRLFDAVAAMTGGWSEVRYEAQAAIELMALTSPEAVAAASPLVDFQLSRPANGPVILPTAGIIGAVAREVAQGAQAVDISARFHRTLLDLLTAAARLAHHHTGLTDVVLAGGVFQNEILVEGLSASLTAAGLRPWRPLRCPANDGAVALGQAAVARAQLGGQS